MYDAKHTNTCQRLCCRPLHLVPIPSIKVMAIALFGAMVFTPSLFGASTLQLPMVAAAALETNVRYKTNEEGEAGGRFGEEIVSSGMDAKQFKGNSIGLKGSSQVLGQDTGKKLAEGEKGCTKNDDCEIGLYCSIRLQFECKPRKESGSGCLVDSDCASGDCAAFPTWNCPRCCTGTPIQTPSRSPSFSPTSKPSHNPSFSPTSKPSQSPSLKPITSSPTPCICEWTGCEWGGCKEKFGSQLPFEHDSKFCGLKPKAEYCCSCPATFAMGVDSESPKDLSFVDGDGVALK